MTLPEADTLRWAATGTPTRRRASPTSASGTRPATSTGTPRSRLVRNSSSTSAVFYGAYGAIVYGLPHGLALLFIAGLVKTLMEIGSVGIPAQATLAATAAPALAVMHIPATFLALIIVAETIPDMIKTVCNITMDVAATTVVDRDRGSVEA